MTEAVDVPIYLLLFKSISMKKITCLELEKIRSRFDMKTLMNADEKKVNKTIILSCF